MRWHRIWAVVVRHLYNFRHSGDKLSDAFYWPAMDIFLWGLTSSYILKQAGNLPNIVLVLLTGLIYWQIVWRSQYEMTQSLLEELWSRNMTNMFASPLTVPEWISGIILLGMLKMVVTIGFASLLAWILYTVNVFSVGFYFLPFLALLLMIGWVVGFIVLGVIITYGTQIQTLAWAGVYILAPFSGIYYPISILPAWAQAVARFIPTSYIFEGMRQIIRTGRMPISNLLISTALTAAYLVLSLGLFVMLFRHRQNKGFSQLDD